MPNAAITKRVVDGALPRIDSQGRPADAYLWDEGKGAVSGFGLKVTAAGAKVFVLQYRIRGAKADKRYRIGRYGDWTPEQARERAKELRRLIDRGTDPFEYDRAQTEAQERAKREAVAKSFARIADQWLEGYKKSKASRDVARITVARLKAAFPNEGIDTITRAQLKEAIDRLEGGPAVRRNFFAYSRILWNWAEDRELISSNPFVGMKSPPLPISRDRVLSDDEIGIIWRASQSLSYPFGPAFRLLAITGQRRTEVTDMAWPELDRAGRAWTIPGSRTKNGLAQIVPLAPAAVDEIDALAPKGEWPSKGLVFTTTGITGISGVSRAKDRLDAKAAEIADQEKLEPVRPWRLHDLRRTVATGLQRLGVRFEVTEAVLNHRSGSRAGVAGVYQRHDWAAEKRAALEAWGRHIAQILEPADGSNVVELATRAG